ncbi:MAG: hypothetical protein ACR2IV_19090 [Bryobacteraceae bacterium]
MAYDLRRTPKPHHSVDTWLLNDLRTIEKVVGSCFEGLGFLRRKATMLSILIAAKCAAGTQPSIELQADGWKLSPDCSEASDNTIVATGAVIQFEESSNDHDLSALIKKSYIRDYDSQRARIALRTRKPDAPDKYFIDDDDDSEVSQVLERFRERSRFQLIGV